MTQESPRDPEGRTLPAGKSGQRWTTEEPADPEGDISSPTESSHRWAKDGSLWGHMIGYQRHIRMTKARL